MPGEAARGKEIAFLQEQNQQILAGLEICENERDSALEKIQACQEQDNKLGAELEAERDHIKKCVKRLQDDKSEVSSKEEYVKVLAEQNNQMLNLLEQEETKSKEAETKIRLLEKKNSKLTAIAEAFDTEKSKIDKEVTSAKDQAVEIQEAVKSQRSLNENVRANIQNTEASTRVEIESLQQALQVVDNKNLEYLQRINKQESKEKQLQSETATLKEDVETVRGEIDALRRAMEGDNEGRTSFEKDRSQIETSIQALEVQQDTLKKALNTAERANEQLQDECRTSAERCRETADKVYALMDSLRLNQVELKKQEAENGARDKKIVSLDRATSNLSAKITMEQDAKVLAEQERKEAEQEAGVLKKKNRQIEEAVTLSQHKQEKLEKEISEMNEQVSTLQTQNAYLTSRMDTQEAEKNSVKAEIKKATDRLGQVMGGNTGLRSEIENLEEQEAQTVGEKDQLLKELEFIKREDVLDDAGRQKPICIQSTESDLLEKLQINDFLIQAQQARNPVPPMIEKIAQLLAMLHEGQSRADQYLGDLSKSNGLVSALRQRNVVLFSQTQMFDSFKTRALLRYVMNLVEGEHMSELLLDALNFGPREISEMINLLGQYNATDQVFVVSLVDNGLDQDSMNLLLQLVFQLPYLKKLDLKRNCFSQDNIKKIEEELRSIEGVTAVVRSVDQVVKVMSGNQLRLTVDLSEQLSKSTITPEVDFSVEHSLAAEDADPFIQSDAGTSQHPWTKNAANQRSPLQAVPDPSSVENLAKPSAAPQIGGPPVGLGGPGNVANLAKKGQRQRDRVPQPKAGARKAGRAKAAPPADLDFMPSEKLVDKRHASPAPVYQQKPPSSPYSGSMQRSSSLRAEPKGEPRREQRAASDRERSLSRPQGERRPQHQPDARGALGASSSMPTLRGRPGRPPPYAGPRS